MGGVCELNVCAWHPAGRGYINLDPSTSPALPTNCYYQDVWQVCGVAGELGVGLVYY